jgi:hypothetical protein
MIFVRVVEMTVVQIVDVAAVTDGGVAATRTVPVCVVGVGRGGAVRHKLVSFPWKKSSEAAMRPSAA